MQRQLSHIKLSDGEYIGEIDMQGNRQGMGEMMFTDGSLYQGNWMNDKKNGQGSLKYRSGNVYQGFFVNDRKEGYGEFFYAANQEQYKGYWQRDMKNGQGEYYFKNGDRFVGFFLQDMKHGPGTKTARNLKYSGVWEQNLKNGSFEFENLKTGKKGVILFRNNAKVGIQIAPQASYNKFSSVPLGFNAGQRNVGDSKEKSHFNGYYESLSKNTLGSGKVSLSDVKTKPADIPEAVGRRNDQNVKPSKISPSTENEQTINTGIKEESITRDVVDNQNNEIRECQNIDDQNLPIQTPEIPHLKEPNNINKLRSPQQSPAINSFGSNIESNFKPLSMGTIGFSEKDSFRSYGSKTLFSNSQGTKGNSSAKSGKGFYDYKGLKEGIRKGNMNLVSLEQETIDDIYQQKQALNRVNNRPFPNQFNIPTERESFKGPLRREDENLQQSINFANPMQMLPSESPFLSRNARWGHQNPPNLNNPNNIESYSPVRWDRNFTQLNRLAKIEEVPESKMSHNLQGQQFQRNMMHLNHRMNNCQPKENFQHNYLNQPGLSPGKANMNNMNGLLYPSMSPPMKQNNAREMLEYVNPQNWQNNQMDFQNVDRRKISNLGEGFNQVRVPQQREMMNEFQETLVGGNRENIWFSEQNK